MKHVQRLRKCSLKRQNRQSNNKAKAVNGVHGCKYDANKNKKPPHMRGFLYKYGGDLLSQRTSTIGANGLNDSVRNGKR
jgi:hypothetical protein